MLQQNNTHEYPSVPEGCTTMMIGETLLIMGQTSLYTAQDAPLDTRSWWEQAIYAIIMVAHNKAEDLWHWLYYRAQRFAPPRSFRPSTINGPISVQMQKVPKTT